VIYQLQTPTQIKSLLEDLRKNAGYTQEDVGGLLGITQQAYQKIERMPERVSIERIMQILRLFNAELAVQVNVDPEFKKIPVPRKLRTKLIGLNDAATDINAESVQADIVVQENTNIDNEIFTGSVMIVKPTGNKADW
jgi:transcriptional regulator with XRE-family HTH domain